MKFFSLTATTLLLLALYLPVIVQAQEPTELETATVTATNGRQLQRETGRNITIIRGAQFEKMPVNSVDELLRYAAGIEVQQRGPQGAQSDLLIRGGTFQQVLVLIDGIRLNDPLTGHFNGNIPIHPLEIDRIEILKGTASAIYGSEAVGGVIHIITKAFTTGARKEGRTVNLGLQLGEYGLRNFNAYAGQQSKNHYWSAGAFSNNADGQLLRGTKGFFNANTLNAAYSGRYADGWQLSARAALDFRKFNAQNFYTSFAGDTANEIVNTQFAQVSVHHNKGVQAFTAHLAYKFLSDEYQFSPLSTANKNRSRQVTGQLHYSTRVDEHTNMSTGLQVFNRVIRSNDRGDHGLWHAAGWVSFRHVLGNNCFLNEGMRLDWDESYGARLVPQVNFSYVPSRWSFRASAGRGIRDADFTERYNNYQKPLVTGGSIGNPGLVNEDTWNLEAGFDYLHQPRLKISGTAFYRTQDDLIDWKPTPYAEMPRKNNLLPTGMYALASNIGNVKTYGAELDIVYQQQLAAGQRLQAGAGITWLRSKTNDATPSFYISSHARFLTNFNVLYSHSRFNIGINGLFKQRNAQQAQAINATISKSYFLLNARAEARFNKGSLGVFIQLHNVLDTEYSDLLGARMPGRWLSGGMNFSFN